MNEAKKRRDEALSCFRYYCYHCDLLAIPEHEREFHEANDVLVEYVMTVLDDKFVNREQILDGLLIAMLLQE